MLEVETCEAVRCPVERGAPCGPPSPRWGDGQGQTALTLRVTFGDFEKAMGADFRGLRDREACAKASEVSKTEV